MMARRIQHADSEVIVGLVPTIHPSIRTAVNTGKWTLGTCPRVTVSEGAVI